MTRIKGIQISQEGISVERAADYQKVLDSRWKFIEVEHELDLSVAIPAQATAATNAFQRVEVFKHNLDYVPVFHCGWTHDGPASSSYNSYGEVLADDKMVYFEREIYTPAGNTAPAVALRLRAKVYNLAAFQEYRALLEVSTGIGKTKSGIGVKVLDGSDSNVRIFDQSPVGFSVDTRKKVLSAHKVSTKFINAWVYDTARITSVNTTTDTMTFTVDPNSSPTSTTGVSWIQTGLPVTFSPADSTTYPAPLGGSTYYIIKTGDTTMKVALSKAAAEAGSAIDLTSAGSLPLFMRRGATIDDDRISHETGYPPSYLFCEYVINRATGGLAVHPLFHETGGILVRADTNYLYFTSPQAVYAARIAYVILKDPVELAS